MNTRGVNALAGVIQGAMRTRQTAAGIAMAVDAAGMCQSPETAAELVALRSRVEELEKRLVPLPDYRLKSIRDREAAATPGPWCTDDWEIYQGAEYAAGAMWIGETCRGGTTTLEQDRADAAFVAAARADVPLLLDHVTVLETVLAAAEARVAELEQQLADARAERAARHDDLAGALGYSGEEWADLVSIAAANTAALARGGVR